MKLSKNELLRMFDIEMASLCEIKELKEFCSHDVLELKSALLEKNKRLKVKEIIKVSDFNSKVIFDIYYDALFLISGNSLADSYFDDAYAYATANLFPKSRTVDFSDRVKESYELFFRLIRIFGKMEKASKKDSFICNYPLELLDKEYAESKEYGRFRYAFENDFVYEIMKLNQDVGGFNTLEHISGVYFVAMHTARELIKTGVPVDLAMVSGAAAGHDIGKYGCVGNEMKRVPYLHYYYTDVWFKQHNIPFIGNVAVNHSTWDLELETLPIESLILIYSDFRVKNKFTKGIKKMHIYTLEESFKVILDMLDNVDEVKEKRYKKVYAKLIDFEIYMGNMGVSIFQEPDKYKRGFLTTKPVELMEGNEVVNFIKQAAIDHNVRLMSRLSNEQSFNKLLDMAGGTGDWREIRGYLDILDGYYVYLTQGQKLTTCKFLYDLLYHKEEDVRNQSASIIGKLIASYEEEYRKEVPEASNVDFGNLGVELFNRYLEMFLFPDHKMIDTHKERIGINTKIMISSLFKNSTIKKNQGFYAVIKEYLKKAIETSEESIIYLVQGIKHLKFDDIKDDGLEELVDFLIYCLNSANLEIVVSSIKTSFVILCRIDENSKEAQRLLKVFLENSSIKNDPTISFLKYRAGIRLGLDSDILSKLADEYEKADISIMELYLVNLKNATSWLVKKANIDILLDEALSNETSSNLQTAMHFCNLLKVSATESVRNHGGKALVKMFNTLGEHERNEVCIELNGALSMQDYQFTKYIPTYLANLIEFLKPTEYKEHMIDLYDKIKMGSTKTSFLALRCVAELVGGFEEYSDRYKLADKEKDDLLCFMLGALLNGLYNYNTHVQQEAFGVIGKEIFASENVKLPMKHKIFKMIKKKLANISKLNNYDDISFFGFTASLNNIYRFISEYEFAVGKFEFNENRPIAFFPGTFDPFSLSHKEIAKEIRNNGFEVYLAIDEFSWSKRTQPNGMRREIAAMSISDEMNIYVYPERIQINIANEKDIERLKESFGKRRVYIVVGSDVVVNASSYKKPASENSIHSLDHVVFERVGRDIYDMEKLEKALEPVKGHVVRLTLPTRYEDISSTQIRQYIDENRDITQLIDSLAQKYIYEYGLYRREPQYKSVLTSQFLEAKTFETVGEGLLISVNRNLFGEDEEAHKEYEAYMKLYKEHKESLRLISIRDKKTGELIAFSTYHVVRSSKYFSEFGDEEICDYIRNNAIGRVALINGIYVNKNSRFENIYQIALTETLSSCLEKDYTYAVFKNILPNYDTSGIDEVLELQGFLKVSDKSGKKPIYIANMTYPCTLNLDMSMIMKEPIKSNKVVNLVLTKTRKRLQKALTYLYPGQLVLSFDMDVMNEKIIRKICEINGVSNIPSKEIGERMCVPFGSILNSTVIPNTVTKSLHTEKVYSHDVSLFTIEAYPNYMSIENQVKMLNSFNRPIILLDDLLHKGYRINALDPVLKKYGVDVEKLVFGVMTGRGKEIMDTQNREVDSAYFIPNIRAWFNEKGMYPFVGGDSVDRGMSKKRYMLPSIYFTLPYASPSFVKHTQSKAVYELSKVCLENSIELFESIETEYQKINERNFTLKHLGEVFTSPRCPDIGENIEYDLSLKPSEYLKNDLERLKRIHFSLI